MKEKTSPLQNLLARLRIGPKPAAPVLAGKLLTPCRNANAFPLDAEDAAMMEKWRPKPRPPASPSNG